jgi:hypothetical protein
LIACASFQISFVSKIALDFSKKIVGPGASLFVLALRTADLGKGVYCIRDFAQPATYRPPHNIQAVTPPAQSSSTVGHRL